MWLILKCLITFKLMNKEEEVLLIINNHRRDLEKSKHTNFVWFCEPIPDDEYTAKLMICLKEAKDKA